MILTEEREVESWFNTYPSNNTGRTLGLQINHTVYASLYLSFLSIDWSRDILAVALNKRGKHHVNCHNMTQHSTVAPCLSVVSPGCRDPGARLSILQWNWGGVRTGERTGCGDQTRQCMVSGPRRSQHNIPLQLAFDWDITCLTPDSWIKRV